MSLLKTVWIKDQTEKRFSYHCINEANIHSMPLTWYYFITLTSTRSENILTLDLCIVCVSLWHRLYLFWGNPCGICALAGWNMYSQCNYVQSLVHPLYRSNKYLLTQFPLVQCCYSLAAVIFSYAVISNAAGAKSLSALQTCSIFVSSFARRSRLAFCWPPTSFLVDFALARITGSSAFLIYVDK